MLDHDWGLNTFSIYYSIQELCLFRRFHAYFLALSHAELPNTPRLQVNQVIHDDRTLMISLLPNGFISRFYDHELRHNSLLR